MDEFFSDFEKYRISKRVKISTMDSIIRNNIEDFSRNEIDVLFRGYIVLIYAFWEGSYKMLITTLYNFCRNLKIRNLPFNIRNPVVINLATYRKNTNYKISEIKDYNYIIEINDDIQSFLNKRLNSCLQDPKLEKNIMQCFKVDSNNPNYNIFTKFLSKYSLSLNKIITNCIEDNLIPNNFKEILDFIISARNSIAHGYEHLDQYIDYRDYIESKFLNIDKKNTEGVSDFLRDSTFYMNILYSQIVQAFKDRYMHHE
ncbi:HEPN domain-containing protein [Clostridium tyrobutyricum]|uniref:HEPN domain-containing protein n=1 Tax=Clostridium tyrobutyricum TaxID=1519 RepID=UPI001C38105E|nr:MAE_28990/MAE_18760 family HEPN-like nuclease [Clostridium tyrobutyricum]MBV4426389.1 hypothetical protein [Clostridium tyrobutyricum]